MIRLVQYFLLIVPAITILIDSTGNTSLVKDTIGISSGNILLISLLILSYLRITKSNKLFDITKYRTIILFLFLPLLLITLTLSIIDAITPENYIYSITRIHQQGLGLLTLFLGSVLLLAKSNKWWKKYYKIVVLLSPLAIILTLSITKLWPYNYYYGLVKEDGLIEYLQVLALVLAVVIMLKNLFKFKSQMKLYEILFFSVAVLSLFFVAGDEIAWGQRILGIETPESLAEINRQEEITVHNIRGIEWMVEIAYVVIGLTGGLLWIIKKYLTKLHTGLKLLVPSYYFSLLFLIPAIYYLYPIYSTVNLISEWSEVMELLLYMGISGHLIEQIYNTVSSKSLSK